MAAVQGPAAAPCVTCPYRRDVPSGIWAPSEYAKLERYDEPTGYQPAGVFHCHQTDLGDPRSRVCAGWAHLASYDTLALRVAVPAGTLTIEQVEEIADYRSSVPVFASGAQAAAHGMMEVPSPGPAAEKAIGKIIRKRGL